MKDKVTKLEPTDLKHLKRMRVGIYARVSTSSDEALASLSAQIAGYHNYVAKHPNWILADFYIDEGVSGTKDTRPEFNRMLRDCEAGKLDLIITKTVSRLARNTATLIKTVNRLKELEIGIIFENQGINTLDKESSSLLINALAAFSEFESRSASENQRWKVEKSFNEGIPTFFRILGYKMIDHKLYIVEDEANIVREIFGAYLSGLGTYAIAKRMNNKGYKTLGGYEFTPSKVAKMLSNEKYAGNLLLQKTFIPDYLTKKQVKNRGEVASYLVEDAHEPIIDADTFNQVQTEIKRRKRRTHPNTKAGRNSGEIFTGLLTCSNCRKKYVHKYSINKKTKRAMWSCASYQKYGKSVCSNHSIPERILITLIADTLSHKYQPAIPYTEKDITHDLIQMYFERIMINEDNTITFYFRDGINCREHWEHISRKYSWDEKMKKEARERTLNRNK